ncbi:uncharacterized protein A1O5_08565 [Cladophialophora psammophila CBS 110553]|uniref:Heterokaryon incompatibility domain-containing protein n=1 Tax=Cladophialophora psammophila CBS 110553 TaxID=1182543 RepID=W9WTI9_9EURO|nr:uncharacterized protein A1O5_08565 [Cladophialophora psammophila CBS 110553]EXJ67951.1 hypothetical protein A1O5_08565 [Cladophialophora psammophila CBS 110553]
MDNAVIRTQTIPHSQLGFLMWILTTADQSSNSPWVKVERANTSLSVIMNGIPIESLPQTFKDVVTVARELSVRFVWIDSLCIVQDSALDWEVESRRMGEYYANSLLTLAAISASSSSGGLFSRRNPLELSPCPVAIKLPGSNSYTFGFSKPSRVEDPSKRTDGFQRPPLWQRAWVLQERLLSPRLLMFSTTQMSWRCRSKEASEQTPEGSSMWIGRSNEDRVVKPILDRLQRQDSGATEQVASTTDPDISVSDMKDIYDAWYDLIMLYGKCNLTYASDVFPAISGIASSISRASGDWYVAGLWKSDLHRGLMWTAPDSTSSRADLREYRAPSWSWASLPATCTFFVRELIQDKPDASCMDIEDVVVHVKGANPFGEISSARLQIKAFLKPAWPYFREGDIDPLLEEIKTRSRSGDSLFDLNTLNPVGRYTPDNIDRRHITQIWCSPVMTEIHPASRMKENQIGAQCVALYPLDKERMVYMRVGFAWVHDFEWFSDCVKTSYYVV